MPACPNAAGKAIKTAVKVVGWVGIDNFKLAVDSFTEGSVVWWQCKKTELKDFHTLGTMSY